MKGLFDGHHYFKIRNNDKGGVEFIHGENFSGILVAGPIFSFAGVKEAWVLQTAGGGLLIFVFQLVLAIKKPSRAMVNLIIYQDLAWVVGAVVLLAFGTIDLTKAGQWLMIGVAAVVLILGIATIRSIPEPGILTPLEVDPKSL